MSAKVGVVRGSAAAPPTCPCPAGAGPGERGSTTNHLDLCRHPQRKPGLSEICFTLTQTTVLSHRPSLSCCAPGCVTCWPTSTGPLPTAATAAQGEPPATGAAEEEEEEEEEKEEEAPQLQSPSTLPRSASELAALGRLPRYRGASKPRFTLGTQHRRLAAKNKLGRPVGPGFRDLLAGPVFPRLHRRCETQRFFHFCPPPVWAGRNGRKSSVSDVRVVPGVRRTMPGDRV